MGEHPNADRVRDGFTAFAKGDFAVMTDLIAEDAVWHVGGRNQLAGEYRGRDVIFGFFGKLMEVTEGSFRMDLHAVLADDEHAVALAFTTASRGGQSVTGNAAHVFHMRDSKVVEYWEATTDRYSMDELLG